MITGTQKQRALKHLQSGRKLTRLKDFKVVEALNLPDVIHRLRKDGHNIETEIITVGKKKTRVARYFMPTDISTVSSPKK